LVGGFEVLVGRGDVENDELTFRIAESRDLWLHVAGGIAGSHVVIRNPQGGDVPRTVIERAAGIAGWYSKARSRRKHYCHAREVKKPRGAPVGLVELGAYESVRVHPTPPGSDDT
jgi:predicted ribosome quality control (RQC) complex YloA/Tae2 family protein